MTRVILRSQAKRNLDSIERYIGRDNPSRALTFVQELRQRCHDLAALPQQGPPFPTPSSHIRRLVHGNYHVFYRYDEEQDAVFILRVTEHHQNQSRILFED